VGTFNIIDLVGANVDRNVAVGGDEFDDGDFRFRDPCVLRRIRNGTEDGDIIHD
jgi:hypothetical protein